MAIGTALTPWLQRHRVLLASLLLLPLLWGGYRIYKDITMPPPLVFLIPEGYFGPVFFLFGQPDGVDVQPDPLGNAVTIPANGILKIKARSKDVMGSSREGYRAIWMISVSKTGQRKVLKMHGGANQDEKGNWSTFYFDENTVLHQWPTASQVGKPQFYYFTERERNEPMVFAHDGCKDQGFVPPNDANAVAPACGKFLLVSPNQYLNLPDFMWEEFAHPFYSIGDLILQADEALVQKKAFYKLP